MQPKNIEKPKAIISPARLSSYHLFFKPTCDEELFGVYCWNIQLSSCFYNLISIVEVTLRNRIHFALSNHILPGTNSFPWYNHLNLHPKTENKIKEITHYKRRGRGQWIPKKPAPSPDDVVSRLTFGVWKNLLDVQYDQKGNSIPWGSLIPNILVNHRTKTSSFWGRQKNQDFLFARIGLVGNLRNRICHFEPIWKQGDLMEERRFRPGIRLSTEHNAPTTVAESIARLRLLHSRTVELLFWLSKSRASDYTTSENCKKFLAICSGIGLTHYKNLAPHIEININNLKHLKNHIHQKRMIKIVDNNGHILAYNYPQ